MYIDTLKSFTCADESLYATEWKCREASLFPHKEGKAEWEVGGDTLYHSLHVSPIAKSCFGQHPPKTVLGFGGSFWFFYIFNQAYLTLLFQPYKVLHILAILMPNRFLLDMVHRNAEVRMRSWRCCKVLDRNWVTEGSYTFERQKDHNSTES